MLKKFFRRIVADLVATEVAKRSVPAEQLRAPSNFRAGSGSGPWRGPKAGAELIREALPQIFQRTHKNISPLPSAFGGRACSMDAALEQCGARPLPDIYRVQDTVPALVMNWFAAHSFIGHQACAILAQHWLIAKACGQAPKDAVQNGFNPVAHLPQGEVPPELLQRIKDINKDWDILKECREFSRNARIFGIRHALFLVDGLDYEAPFNLDGVRPGSYKGISQIDPYWLTPEFDLAAVGDPAARHFYEPTWWRTPNGRRIHRSHFVILREDEVPDVLKPTYYYGGLPMPQLIFERCYAAERTADEGPQLAMTKRQIVLNEEVDFMLSDEEESEERLYKTQYLRDNYGVWAVGDAEVKQLETTLADLDSVIMTQYQLVAAIARTPATKLLGTSPKGFNATGEHESGSYDQELVSIQTDSMTPLLDRHHQLLCRSEFYGHPGLSISVEWEPVRKLTPVEIADLNLKNAQAAQLEQAVGAISGDEERARLQADPLSPYKNLPDDLPDDFYLDDGGPADPGMPAGMSMDAEFKESDHPRGKDGKFGAGGAAASEGKDAARDISGLLGEEHKGVKGQAAIEKLMQAEGGHVKGAFERPDIGKIDLAWGDDTFGLKHIIRRRAEQGLEPGAFLSDLAEVVERGQMRLNERGNYEILHNGKEAIISQELRGNKMTLLLTAYKTRKKRR
ncbi:DUF1073 domain-containing protein [Desulfovibrio sp. OttesenSCG-928-C14]|nr:DUF1073 domain-containing protein [Desulfovibrio sp. OttesenSCG-928-C14]